VAEAKVDALEEERRALSTRLLSSVEARLEATRPVLGTLEGVMEARVSLLPNLEAVVSAAETANANAASQRAAGRACCSV